MNDRKTTAKSKKVSQRKAASRGAAAKKRAGGPPIAARRPVTSILHGVKRTDDYAWIRADNWQEVLRDPETLPIEILEYLQAENAYTEVILGKAKRLQSTLVREMRGRIKEDDSGVPADDGPWSYFYKFRKGGNHPLICRRPREGGKMQIMLDGDKLAKGKSFFDLGDGIHSPDHKLLAWSADENGSEFHTIRVRDLATGKDLPDEIIDTDGDVVWTANSKFFYYTKLDSNCRPREIFRHKLGDDPKKDTLIYREKQTRWHLNLNATQSGRFATIEVSDQETSELYLVDLRKPRATAQIVEPRKKGVQYDVEDHDSRLFIITNADKAEDFKIMAAPLKTPGRKYWAEFIPYRPGCMISGMAVYKRHLVRIELEDGLPRIVVHTFRGGKEHAISFDEEAYDLDLGEVLEYDTDTIRFVYSSLTTPPEVYDYNMATGKRTLRKRRQIPSGHNPAKYVSRRIFATAHDGEKIPISILHSRKTKLDGSAPLLLTAYGSYGHAYEASFGANRLSLVDRGFVFAIAHVRGGSDRGRRWYLDGKMNKKKNTFLDFISVGRHLAAENFTREGNIVAVGRSAGGLLMGAVANMAPELFAGIIADVPFVDAVNSMSDGNLPLTPPEWLEWGNPVKNATAFAYMLSYSPYENVRAQYYPAMLVQGGLTDPRVTYWEPAKYVAKLRANITGGGPIMLRTNMDGGHSGSPGRFDRLPDVAREYAFAIMCVEGKLTS